MRLLHTMLRVGDLQKSLDFYQNVLGMKLLRKKDYPDGRFTLAFVGYGEEADSTVLELTHNWGTENDPAFNYHNGNSEPRGYGHICISVPDFDAAIRWFDANHVPYQKRPEEGTMHDIAFLKDPDGYWVEIIKGC